MLVSGFRVASHQPLGLRGSRFTAAVQDFGAVCVLILQTSVGYCTKTSFPNGLQQKSYLPKYPPT